jgi:hypothetical protein
MRSWGACLDARGGPAAAAITTNGLLEAHAQHVNAIIMKKNNDLDDQQQLMSDAVMCCFPSLNFLEPN